MTIIAKEVRSQTFYCRLTKTNVDFLTEESEKLGYSQAELADLIITDYRTRQVVAKPKAASKPRKAKKKSTKRTTRK